jgi:hypothetical protein
VLSGETDAPSHLCGGNHQEQQEIHSKEDPLVPLDANSQSKCTRSVQSHTNAISTSKCEWRGFLSSNMCGYQLGVPRVVKNVTTPSIYKPTQKTSCYPFTSLKTSAVENTAVLTSKLSNGHLNSSQN